MKSQKAKQEGLLESEGFLRVCRYFGSHLEDCSYRSVGQSISLHHHHHRIVISILILE